MPTINRIRPHASPRPVAKSPTTLAEFCVEADRIGLTASTLAAQLMLVPAFADCWPIGDRDGNALRLAIEHRVSVKQQYGRVIAKGKFVATVSFRDCGGDSFAATRLAIELAAGLPSREPA